MKSVGKPDARNGHVRFDERGWETGWRSASALAPSLDSTPRGQAHFDAEDLTMLDRSLKPVVEPGMFRVLVGHSSGDIRLNGEFEVR